MGIYEVWEVFEKNPNKWITKKDIQKITKTKSNTITNALRNLRRNKIIYRIIKYDGPHKRSMDMIRKYKLTPKNKKVIHNHKKDILINKETPQ